MRYVFRQEAGIIFVSWNKQKFSAKRIKKSLVQIKNFQTPTIYYFFNTICYKSFHRMLYIYCFRWENKLFFLKCLV